MEQFTEEEKQLLTMLKEGQLDGFVEPEEMKGCKTPVWQLIKYGVPHQFRQIPSFKFFAGRETRCTRAVVREVEAWLTDEEKILFLRDYGWMIDNNAVKEYSLKFNPSKAESIPDNNHLKGEMS